MPRYLSVNENEVKIVNLNNQEVAALRPVIDTGLLALPVGINLSLFEEFINQKSSRIKFLFKDFKEESITRAIVKFGQNGTNAIAQVLEIGKLKNKLYSTNYYDVSTPQNQGKLTQELHDILLRLSNYNEQVEVYIENNTPYTKLSTQVVFNDNYPKLNMNIFLITPQQQLIYKLIKEFPNENLLFNYATPTTFINKEPDFSRNKKGYQDTVKATLKALRDIITVEFNAFIAEKKESENVIIQSDTAESTDVESLKLNNTVEAEDISHYVNEIERLKTTISELTDKLTEKTTFENILNDKISELENINNTLKNQLSEVQTSNIDSELNSKLEELQNQHMVDTEEIRTLTEKVVNLSSIEMSYKELQHKYETLERDFQNLTEDNRKLYMDYMNVNDKFTSASMDKQELQDKLTKLESTMLHDSNLGFIIDKLVLLEQLVSHMSNGVDSIKTGIEVSLRSYPTIEGLESSDEYSQDLDKVSVAENDIETIVANVKADFNKHFDTYLSDYKENSVIELDSNEEIHEDDNLDITNVDIINEDTSDNKSTSDLGDEFILEDIEIPKLSDSVEFSNFEQPIYNLAVQETEEIVGNVENNYDDKSDLEIDDLDDLELPDLDSIQTDSTVQVNKAIDDFFESKGNLLEYMKSKLDA